MHQRGVLSFSVFYANHHHPQRLSSVSRHHITPTSRTKPLPISRSMSEKRWIPLESNPEVLTKYGRKLGLSTLMQLCDVWSLDLLDTVPSPRFAVILLYPLTEKTNTASAHRTDDIETDVSKMPFFCRQTIGNACGTIALLHAGLNADVSLAPLTPASFFASFHQRTRDMTPQQRADALQQDECLDAAHGEFAQEGQTEAPSADDKLDMHFVCFVEKDGTLYELDGRKEGPVRHGSCTKESLLEDAGKVIREEFMTMDPTEHRFTVMALTLAVE